MLVATDSRSDSFITPRTAASRQNTTILTLKHQANHVDIDPLGGMGHAS
jgi:hypothetical protein